MKTLLKFSLLIVSLVIIAGCAGAPQAPVMVPKNVLIAPDDDQIVDCLLAPPPNAAAFKLADNETQKQMLFDYAGMLVKNTIDCNKRMAALRSWKQQQESLYGANAVGGGGS